MSRQSDLERDHSRAAEEFACAKKEKLCFQCLSNKHSKQDCPQLQGKDKDKGKGLVKAIHMVQVLPLNASQKYSAVEVSHSTDVHELCY